MTQSPPKPAAMDAGAIAPVTGSSYPAEFKPRVAGRSKQKLGDAFGLKNFGVNLTTIKPGSASALRHWHAKQDEFIYMVSGELVLVTDAGRAIADRRHVRGFPGGKARRPSPLVNRTDA